MALLKRVVACLDIRDGQVVKGRQFIALTDLGDAVDMALAYEQQGADEIVVLDISATQQARLAALHSIKAIAQQLSIPLTVGGGVRKLDDVHTLLAAGADKVAINSAALSDPELIDKTSQHFGSQCMVVAIDFRDALHGGEVWSHGGSTHSGRRVDDWARECVQRGAGELLLTCIDHDGTGLGFEKQITGKMSRELRVPVVASGGAARAQDFVDIFQAGADAALAAGIFHRGEVQIADIKNVLERAAIPVRRSQNMIESQTHADPQYRFI